MQIRNEVEQAMLDAPQRSFDEICLSACDARASELKVADSKKTPKIAWSFLQGCKKTHVIYKWHGERQLSERCFLV